MYTPEDLLRFFDKSPDSLRLYQAFEKAALSLVPGADIRVQKTQITFVSRHVFACASLARVLRAAQCPRPFLTITFSLPAPAESPRVAVCCEPYPGRFTHHVVVGSVCQIDEELMDWISQSAAFAASKR